jgi:hypothetical protein
VKRKSSEREQALKLRRQGKSIKEIAHLLGVAKSSVSLWVRDLTLSPTAQRILLGKITAGQYAGGKSRRVHALEKDRVYFEAAQKKFKMYLLNNAEKLLICSLIYWCEGAKNPNRVDFTNADPDLVKLFLSFLRDSFVLDERKFSVCIHIHSYHNMEKQLKVWSEFTQIPKKQFTKPFQKVHSGKQTREGYQGCASIRYNDADIARRLLATARAALTCFLDT